MWPQAHGPGAQSLCDKAAHVGLPLPSELIAPLLPQNEREQIMTTNVWLKQVSALRVPSPEGLSSRAAHWWRWMYE